jgi:hypothetical protein
MKTIQPSKRPPLHLPLCASLVHSCAIAAAIVAIVASDARAQPQFATPGPNANIIGVTPDPAHVPDFALKQQQEPSCIVRPANSAYILCAYNDMRASDRPAIQGDGWIGVSMSADAGETWFSRLSPGYLGHSSSLQVGFAADPGLVSIPGDSAGLAVLNFIGGFRDRSAGVLAVQRWVEYAQEDGNFWRPENAIHIIAQGAGGQGRFLDKPAFYYLLDAPSAQTTLTESISVEGAVEPVSVTTPSGTLIAAYAVFTGNVGSQIWIQLSTDNGKTWGQATKLTEEQNEVTGVSLTAVGQTVVAAWRRRGDTNEGDAVMSAVSTDGGRRWTKGALLFDLCPFDQPATGATFRTFAFPWLANDGARFWAFAADRRFAGDGSCTPLPAPAPAGTYSGIPRVVGMTSSDGLSWVGARGSESAPFVVDPQPAGYQLMPAAFGTKGRIDLAWYDTRREEPLPAGNGLPLINDYLAAGGLARVLRSADVYMTRLTAHCPGNARAGCTPQIEPSIRVSRYPFVLNDVVNEGTIEQVGQEVEAHRTNLRLYGSGTLAFKGDYIAVATPAQRKIASGRYIPNSWPEGAAGSELPGFVERQDVLVAWGDNRSVRADFGLDPTGTGQLPYTPTTNSAVEVSAAADFERDETSDQPLLAGEKAQAPVGKPGLEAVTEPDDEPTLPSDVYQCSASFDYSRSRDGNIFASVVADRPSLTSPTSTKPLGGIQRMFPLQISNPSTEPQTFCLVIGNQPGDAPHAGRASFYQLPAIAPFTGAPVPVTALEVDVPALSSVFRAAFVATGDPSTVITVDAYEGPCGNPGSLSGSLALGDGALFDPQFCAVPVPPERQEACLSVASNETHDITLVSPSLQAPVLQAPVLQAPGLQAPVLQAPVLQAPSFQAPSFQAPGLQAPVLQAPGFQANTLLAPGLQAPSLQAPSLQAAALADPSTIVYQDVSYIVSTDANVTTTYSADIAISGLDPDEFQVQLVAWTPNVYGTTENCLTVPTADNQVIAAVDLDAPSLQAVTLPSAFTPENQNPYAGEISFAGTPGKDIALTVRIWATAGAAQTLNDLNQQYLDCIAAEDSEICDPSTAGAASLITFGASANACSTHALPDPDDPSPGDCLNNGKEKILVDLAPPQLSPPSGTVVTLEAQSAAGATIASPAGIPTFVQAIDTSAPVTVTCTSDDLLLGDPQTVVPLSGTAIDSGTGEPILVPSQITCSASDSLGNTSATTFGINVLDTVAPTLSVAVSTVTIEADAIQNGVTGAAVDYGAAGQSFVATDTVAFPQGASVDPNCQPASGGFFGLGTTAVSCTIADGGPNATAGVNVSAPATFDVIVSDSMGPVIAAEDLTFTTLETSVLVDYLATVSATDLGAPVPVSCNVAGDSTNPYEFPIGVTSVSCSATDGTNTTEATFNVSVVFGYRIAIAPIRGRIGAGSTVPLDWRYLDLENGRPINSSSLQPSVGWLGPFSSPGCSGPTIGTGNGEDAGSSSFRYTPATFLWQYSWQTPTSPGYYRLTITPPGGDEASICVSLR